MNYDIELDGRKHRLSLQPTTDADRYRVLLDDQAYEVDAYLLQPGVLSLLIEGKSYRILLDARPTGSAIVQGEQRMPYTLDDPRSLRSRANADAGGAGTRSVTAPMPGRIVRILVRTGEIVEARQGLIVIEAMKMQNELKAPKAGTIARISVEAGATVQAGEVLLVIE